MRSLAHRLISANTGSNALECGLIVALVAVSVVVGIAKFDLTRPVDHALSPKVHSQVDRIS
jgi:Flp pilus assembly pilin Flp